jgi:ribosomal protein S27E
MAERCPRDDRTKGNAKDVTEVTCPDCGTQIEFWGAEQTRKCPDCRAEVALPAAETE